jgi:hypothetical protein
LRLAKPSKLLTFDWNLSAKQAQAEGMNKDEMARVADLLRQFEREGPENPQQGEKLIAEVFRVCGQEVVESGFAETGARNIDCFFRTTLAGKPQTIGVEIKAGNVAADDATVDYAYSMLETGRFDRFMVVSRLGYTQAAIARADKYGWGEVDLLDPQGLHNWIFRRREEPKEEADAYDLIITNTMRQLALAIADKPEVLWRVEWRELEKVLRQAFDGIGYETTLTRPAKDGGFDLELTAWDGGMRHTYVVEVKHWKEKRPGSGELRKLISVTASKKATGGLLLSSSGFTDNIHTGMPSTQSRDLSGSATARRSCRFAGSSSARIVRTGFRSVRRARHSSTARRIRPPLTALPR